MVTEGNVFLESGADMARKADGIYLERSGMTPGTLQRPMVTSALLGNTNVSKLPFVNPDGTPHRLDTDYFGSKRNSENPAPGPFSIQTDREMNLNVWPKKRRE